MAFRTINVLGVVLAAMLGAACGPAHVAPFTPRERVYKPGEYAQRDPNAKPSTGSLFSEANGGFLQDTRAVRVGDTVVVHIEESADAQGDSTTALSRDSSGSTGVSSMLGLVPAMKKAYPDIDPTKLIEFASKSGFLGSGSTARKGELKGSIAVRVARELPNGDMFLEGTKVVLINNEEYHLYVSGLVRPADIAQNNTVSSLRIADAQIEFTGRGDVADQQRKGFLARIIDKVNPFLAGALSRQDFPSSRERAPNPMHQPLSTNSRTKRNAWLSLLAMVAALLAPGAARAERLRDLTDVSGARENQLVGYGIVTGLNGTGDDLSAPFAAQSVLSLLRRLGVQVDPNQLRLRNVAAVVVTATLPPFVRSGSKLDVNVASIGNARGLSGGVLVQTLLKGADSHTYAVAQGSVLLGGFEAKGASGSSVKSGTTTSGRVPEGALVEREVQTTLVTDGGLTLQLRNPSFAVASRITEAVDKAFGAGSAHTQDGGAVRIKIPAAFTEKPIELMAALEDLEVIPVRRARVVINERTGTVVAGGDVRLAPAMVSHGGLTIIVKETPQVSQPTAPFGQGTTVVTPKTEIETHEGDKTVKYIPQAPTLTDVASALGALGLSPRELTSVLQALRSAGALEAEVVVQ